MTKTNIKFLDLAHIDKWTREEKIANVILGLLLNNPLYSENMWFYLKDMAVSGQKTTLSEAIDALEKRLVDWEARTTGKSKTSGNSIKDNGKVVVVKLNPPVATKSSKEKGKAMAGKASKSSAKKKVANG